MAARGDRSPQAALGSTQVLLDRADARLRDTFQSLAAEALKDNRASFFDLAKTSFEGYHQPIAESLKKVDARLGEAERDRVAAYSRLSEQIIALGSAAGTLSRALRTPAVRAAGEKCSFAASSRSRGCSSAATSTSSRGCRPTAAVSGRTSSSTCLAQAIVVDAKAPLEAFLDAQECADEESRAIKLQAHARQVRDHMDRLGNKSYWEPLGDSPDMVVMFLPGETLFSAALQHDLGLIEHGLKQRVLLASPITLIALLTTVAHTWRQEALAENYREVAELGRDLYERLS